MMVIVEAYERYDQCWITRNLIVYQTPFLHHQPPAKQGIVCPKGNCKIRFSLCKSSSLIRNKMARQLAFLLTVMLAGSFTRVSTFQASFIVSYRRDAAVQVHTYLSASSASSTTKGSAHLSHHGRPLSLFRQKSLHEEEKGKALRIRLKATAKFTIRRCASRIQTKTKKWSMISTKAPAPPKAATTTRKGNRLASFLHGKLQLHKQQTNSQMLPLSLTSTKERKELRPQGVSTRLAAATLVCLSTLLARPTRVLAAMAGGMGGSKGPVVPMSQYDRCSYYFVCSMIVCRRARPNQEFSQPFVSVLLDDDIMTTQKGFFVCLRSVFGTLLRLGTLARL